QSGARIKVFPTVAAFRDATGEPGWVAASARAAVLRIQPVAALRSRGSLESTLRHEILHALIESRARPGLPIWFREGLVEYLTAGAKAQRSNASPPADAAFLKGQEEVRRAYV